MYHLLTHVVSRVVVKSALQSKTSKIGECVSCRSKVRHLEDGKGRQRCFGKNIILVLALPKDCIMSFSYSEGGLVAGDV